MLEAGPCATAAALLLGTVTRSGCMLSLEGKSKAAWQRALGIFAVLTAQELEPARLEPGQSRAIGLGVSICQPFAADYLPHTHCPPLSFNEPALSGCVISGKGKKKIQPKSRLKSTILADILTSKSVQMRKSFQSIKV